MYQQCRKNMSYVLAIRKFVRFMRSLRAKYISSNIFELTRILNHIMQLPHMQLMLCINPLSLGFEEREIIMNFMNGFLVLDYMQHYFRPGELLTIYQKVY
jgi:NADH:ubiquinone oxidoreductase subunit D